MNFKSVLRSSHDLKKNGYKIIRKLHKLESNKNLDQVYIKKCKEGYFFILSCKYLIKIINNQYGGNESISRELEQFEKRSNFLLQHLENISNKRAHINKNILASYLSAYTNFFNFIIQQDTPFYITQEMLTEWNLKCVMAYYAVWSK